MFEGEVDDEPMYAHHEVNALRVLVPVLVVRVGFESSVSGLIGVEVSGFVLGLVDGDIE